VGWDKQLPLTAGNGDMFGGVSSPSQRLPTRRATRVREVLCIILRARRASILATPAGFVLGVRVIMQVLGVSTSWRCTWNYIFDLFSFRIEVLLFLVS
jgi:hypothetical protein